MAKLRRRGIITILLISMLFISLLRFEPKPAWGMKQTTIKGVTITYDIVKPSKAWYDERLGRKYEVEITYGNLPLIIKFDQQVNITKDKLKSVLKYAPDKYRLNFTEFYIEIGRNTTYNKTVLVNVTWYNHSLPNGTNITKPEQHWGTVEDWRVEYKKAFENKDYYVAQADKWYIINFHGEWQPKLGSCAVDVIPQFDDYNFTEYAWWNASWNNRIAVEITHPNNAIDTGWAVEENVTHYGMKSDGSDIRYIANDNSTVLNQWRETAYSVDSSYHYMWFELSTAGNQTVWRYWNNSDASSTFSMANTFNYSNFENGVWDNTDWYNHSSYPMQGSSDEGDYHQFSAGAGAGLIYYYGTNYSTGTRLIARTLNMPTWVSALQQFGLENDPRWFQYQINQGSPQDNKTSTKDGSTAENEMLGNNFNWNTWYRWDFRNTNTSSVSAWRDFSALTYHDSNVPGDNDLSIKIYLGANSQFRISYLIIDEVSADGIMPTVTKRDINWYDNQTSGTTAGTSVTHSVWWNDSDSDLSGFVFAFCNGTYYPANHDCVNGTTTQNVSASLYNDNFESTTNWIESGDCAAYWNYGTSTPSGGTGAQNGDSPNDDNSKFVYMETSVTNCDGTPSSGYLMYNQNINWSAQEGENITVETNFYGTDANLGELSLQENSTGSWVHLGHVAEDDDGNNGQTWTTRIVDASSLTGTGYIRLYLNECASYKGDASIDNLNITYLTEQTVNDSGWVNDSWATMQVSNYTNATKYVNETVGTVVSWIVWCNDTDNNWGVTPYFHYTTTSATGDTCDYSSGTWEIDCSENCVIDSATNAGGNNIVLTGSGLVKCESAVTNCGDVYLGGGCSLELYANFCG